jgi:NADH-quinone oxidoreductase subunit M
LTLGFVAEDLLVQGSVAEYPALAFVLIGATALNGMTVVRAFFRLFSGRSSHMGESDLTTREGWALSIVLLALLVGGIAPSMIVSREFGGAHAGASSPRDHPGSASLGSAPGIRAVVKGESMIEIHP